MDKISIKDLKLQGILGINEAERVTKQTIVVNVVMFVDVRVAAGSDDIRDAVNYDTIATRIRERVETGDDFLVERLVSDLARMIVMAYPVERVMVRVEKPEAVAGAQSVGVEIERTRADFE